MKVVERYRLPVIRCMGTRNARYPMATLVNTAVWLL